MNAMLQFATLVITTIFAVAAAAGLHWVCLKAAFFMMRPATARRTPFEETQGKPFERTQGSSTALRINKPMGTELVRGTAQLARAYSALR